MGDPDEAKVEDNTEDNEASEMLVEGQETHEMDAEHEVDETANGKRRKKRRVAVDRSEKAHACAHSGCTRVYSRLEHLYRHQLNHTPKQIYHCDFPGCDRHFVRADLCARHKERHTARGSHLQRKDAFMHSQRASAGANDSQSPLGGPTKRPTVVTDHMSLPTSLPDGYPNIGHANGYPNGRSNGYSNGHANGHTEHYPNYSENELPPMHSTTSLPLDPQLAVGGTYNGYATGMNGPMLPPTSAPRRFSQDGAFSRPTSIAPGYGQHQLTVGAMHPPPLTSPQASGSVYATPTYPSAGNQYRPPTNYNLPSLPPFGVPQGYNGLPGNGNGRPGNIMSPQGMNPMDQFQVPNSRANSVVDFNVLDQYAAGYAMPVFGLGNDGYNRSPPLAMDDLLFAQLLESGGLDMNPPSPPPLDPPYLPQMQNTSLPKVEPDGSTTEKSAGPEQWDTKLPVVQTLDLSLRESVITERKQQRLIRLVESFEDIDHMQGRKTKEAILAGDYTQDTHALSLHMLKTCLTSYWVHIHQQMPVLHRPTFNAETCPDLLLFAMMSLGACCLERTHSPEITHNCAELSFFVAYHIRWEVFKDVEFRPTAKLWTFQTMLLLELFEKMYSTRSLHERAHIHHATTLTVMRRGSSLIGRSAIDSLTEHNDPTRTPPGPDGSINTSGQNTPDAFWNRWITAEATRRVAFAAFVIDSTHATLFGHSAVMSPHDMRLPLPCDEALWSATSSAEVQRVEASLAANGFKPATFLEGLKKTLNGQKVRTNTFGRVILMSGLLNVSWHMNQRDLQVHSLGASTTLGNPARWRSPLTRAFDFWRKDFDESLTKNEHWLQVCNPNTKDRNPVSQRDNITESKTCLHSLAHMAMHIDIVDCEVFAGAERALGRIVTDGDRAAIQRRMREQWAPSARARDATFYALRFLCEVLIPDEDLSDSAGKRAKPTQPPTFNYSARDDYLLNRPWILYFACMIVWSYGYALDGPIKPSSYTLTSHELRIHDMQRYLIRVGGVASPDDLENLKDRNSCVGLLLLLRECFQQPRWELLHEASEMLSLCVDALLPGHGEVKSA